MTEVDKHLGRDAVQGRQEMVLLREDQDVQGQEH